MVRRTGGMRRIFRGASVPRRGYELPIQAAGDGEGLCAGGWCWTSAFFRMRQWV
jgi:hypothetical protein